jgi:hypothetical protein
LLSFLRRRPVTLLLVWQNRSHFFAAAEAMRRILLDAAGASSGQSIAAIAAASN